MTDFIVLGRALGDYLVGPNGAGAKHGKPPLLRDRAIAEHDHARPPLPLMQRPGMQILAWRTGH